MPNQSIKIISSTQYLAVRTDSIVLRIVGSIQNRLPVIEAILCLWKTILPIELNIDLIIDFLSGSSHDRKTAQFYKIKNDFPISWELKFNHLCIANIAEIWRSFLLISSYPLERISFYIEDYYFETIKYQYIFKKYNLLTKATLVPVLPDGTTLESIGRSAAFCAPKTTFPPFFAIRWAMTGAFPPKTIIIGAAKSARLIR